MEKGPRVERAVLSNGLTTVVERMPHFPSVTVGVWVKRGSRHEPPSLNGASHFVEHLVFKGTPSRSYTEISKTFDRMGGVLDAFTSREIMGFYFRVQRDHFAEAFDVLSDMLTHPLFPEEEVERERAVILEEIKMVNDSPPEFMGDLFLARAYPKHPLGRPVAGTAELVKAMTRKRIMRHYRSMLKPGNIVVTATGDTNLRELMKSVEPQLGGMKGEAGKPGAIPVFRGGQEVFRKNHLEQAQIVLAFRSEPAGGPNRNVLSVLANALGGTMSSRLFTEIREKRGLVYSISAEQTAFSDAGLFVVSAAASHANARRTVLETVAVIKEAADKGFTEEEVEIAKENLVGELVLSMESPSARMGRLARNEVFYGKQRPAAASIERIRKVSATRIAHLGKKLFDPDNALLCLLGRPSSLPKTALSPLEDVH